MSEAENPRALAPGREVTVEDIRRLAGPSTPHFALQARNRIQRLIAPLPPEHPARVLGERKIAELEALAQESGDPRSTMGIHHA
jgi:hypothetical protein